MGNNFIGDFGLTLLTVVNVAIIAFEVSCTWVLWSAAMAVPQPYRMRWPWVIWLLLFPIPFFYQAICFAALIPLSLSYRRFLKAHGVTKSGQDGFGLALSFCILQLMSFLTQVPTPTPWLHAAWPWAEDFGQWAGLYVFTAFLVLVSAMWKLRKHAMDIGEFVQSGRADVALHALTNLKPDCEESISSAILIP